MQPAPRRDFAVAGCAGGLKAREVSMLAKWPVAVVSTADCEPVAQENPLPKRWAGDVESLFVPLATRPEQEKRICVSLQNARKGAFFFLDEVLPRRRF